MQISIAKVLTPDDLNAVRTALEGARFVDGRATAGFAARLVKNNEQVSASDASLNAIREMVTERILTNDLFRMAVRPKALTPLLFSRYEPGKDYGSHVDDALMQGMRTDVSFTLFLDEPDTYDGGELVLETTGGEDAVKL